MKQLTTPTRVRSSRSQTGGTILGFILGLLVGLGSALAVAVVITNTPVPFMNKIGSRNASQDAKEAEHNRNWDPNALMQGRSARPTPPPAAANPATTDKPATAAGAASANTGAASTAGAQDPLGNLAMARANAPAAASTDGFEYFVQAGAFRTESDADAQRARLAILGWEARISEREQSGRTVFRVRVGPFTKRDEAEALKEKLTVAKVESTLVRVQR